MCIYDVYGPCSCPHGRCFTILAQCFTISSWVCSLMAITSCFYIYIRPIPEEGQPELPREGFGYISRQDGVLEPPNYRQCVWYTGDEKDEYFDAMWRAGKAMSLLACGIGGIVMCILMCTCCVAYQLPTFDAMFWTCIFCFVAQTLTFLSWGSQLCDDYECTWSSGTGMNITAAMLWVWAANMIKSFPEALPPSGRGKRRPVYDDGENDDSPYLNPNRGFEDEYDYGEEDNWQNDGEYYDDDYDDSYYDDSDAMSGSLQNGGQPPQQYDENGQPLPYDQQQGYYDDDGNYHEPDGYLQQPQYDENGQPFQPDGYLDDGSSGQQGGYNDAAYPNNEYATDYDDPSNARAQGQDDDIEPNEHFRHSWKDLDDDESAYNSTNDASTNYFQDSQPSGQNQSQMGNID